jgi:hypothetical protein
MSVHSSPILCVRVVVLCGWGARISRAMRSVCVCVCVCVQVWLDNPELMSADPGAQYAATIDIDMNTITEPILCAPNDPDDARLLSEVMGDKIDEVRHHLADAIYTLSPFGRCRQSCTCHFGSHDEGLMRSV